MGRETMAKLSITAAAKLFDVSRPTILKDLRSGKISGDKDARQGWAIDKSELLRVYQPRAGSGLEPLPQTLPIVSNALEDELKAEIELLKAKLAGAEALADERLRHN